MNFIERVAVECALLGGILVGALAAIGARTENARAVGVIVVVVCTATYVAHIASEARRAGRW